MDKTFLMLAGSIAYNAKMMAVLKNDDGDSPFYQFAEDMGDDLNELENRPYTDEECMEMGRLLLDEIRLAKDYLEK